MSTSFFISHLELLGPPFCPLLFLPEYGILRIAASLGDNDRGVPVLQVDTGVGDQRFAAGAQNLRIPGGGGHIVNRRVFGADGPPE